MTQQQMTHQEARRKEAEEAVDSLYTLINDYEIGEGLEADEYWKALEFLSWEAGVLEYFKRLRSE